MRRGKWTAVAAMVATVAMVTAACGSSGDAGSASGGSGSASAGSGSASAGSGSASAGSGSASAGSSSGSASAGSGSASAGSGSASASAGSGSGSASAGSGSGSASAGSGGASGAAFKFGYVLPQTGALAYLGPPQIQAMKYAISLINKAGGINGQQVAAPVPGDEANDAALAAQAATQEINDGVNAVIGAAATGMTMAIIDKVTGAGIAQCSGSNTGVNLTDYPGKMGPKGNQLYFRTAPSDALQGPVLGKLVLSEGHSNVAIVYRNDDYGKGLANATAQAITDGGGSVVLNEGYDQKTTDFSSLTQKIKSKNPDAVVTVSFKEGWQLWKSLFQAGLTPDKVGIYGADGMRSETAPKDTFSGNAKIVDGAGGTAPASVDNPDFIKALKGFAPKLKETQFAPQVFDCVNIFALAADQAKSNSAADWSQYVVGVTKDGTECNTYADCKKLLDAGTDIHYVGAAGDLSFTDHGEPGTATIEIYKYENGGTLVSKGTQQSTM